MSKTSSASTLPGRQPQAATKRCMKKLKDAHEHIHAANCGHPSFVHGDHLDYLHDGEYHCTHGDHVDVCHGPGAMSGKVLPFKAK